MKAYLHFSLVVLCKKSQLVESKWCFCLCSTCFWFQRGNRRKLLQWVVTLNTAAAWQKVCYLPFTQVKTLLPCVMDRIRTPAVLSQRKRQKGMRSPNLSCSYEIKFSKFVIFIMQRKMGMTRRTFLMELARRKGFRVESELR